MTTDFHPETLILQMGGCGRFQISLSVLVHIMKFVVNWGSAELIFSIAVPDWWCVDGLDLGNATTQLTTNSSRHKACSLANNTKCSSFLFDPEKKTIVSEFSLVCDDAWKPTTTASLQMGGLLLGNILAGHMADGIGRKTPFFLSLVVLGVFNIAAAFSVSWAMFTVSRVFIGAGSGFFLTIQYSLLSEFTLAKWRSWIINFPSWPMETCFFALLAYFLHDWQKLHLTTGILAFPFLLSWWFVPESFRWYVSHNKNKEAERVVKFIAKVNKHTTPNTDRLRELAKPSKDDPSKKMTFIELFRTKYLIKITLCSICNWITLGLVGAGLQFSVPTLSGSLYFNLFLFGILSLPTKFWSIFSQNRYGRKKTTLLVYAIMSITALLAGAVQYIETDMRGSLTTGFVVTCFIFVNAAWGPVQTTTIEMYPTVIRNIGFGCLSIMEGVGAIAGPQIVFLSTKTPGLVFFVCGSISCVCILATLGLPETKSSNLKDKMKTTLHVEQEIQIKTIA